MALKQSAKVLSEWNFGLCFAFSQVPWFTGSLSSKILASITLSYLHWQIISKLTFSTTYSVTDVRVLIKAERKFPSKVKILDSVSHSLSDFWYQIPVCLDGASAFKEDFEALSTLPWSWWKPTRVFTKYCALLLASCEIPWFGLKVHDCEFQEEDYVFLTHFLKNVWSWPELLCNRLSAFQSHVLKPWAFFKKKSCHKDVFFKMLILGTNVCMWHVTTCHLFNLIR